MTFETNEPQTIAAHRLQGPALIEAEENGFWRGYRDFFEGRRKNPYEALFQPDAYEAWGLGQDAAYTESTEQDR